MPASGISLIDANVWLALSFGDHAFHSSAERWFGVQPEASCAFCRVTQMALLRHLTNSKIMGKFVLSQQQAWTVYDSLSLDPRTRFLDEPPNVDADFRSLTQSSFSVHQRWTDAYLAAVAKRSAFSIVTFDQGFRQFAGINLIELS